jgi:hypothetical protein
MCAVDTQVDADDVGLRRGEARLLSLLQDLLERLHLLVDRRGTQVGTSRLVLLSCVRVCVRACAVERVRVRSV